MKQLYGYQFELSSVGKILEEYKTLWQNTMDPTEVSAMSKKLNRFEIDFFSIQLDGNETERHLATGYYNELNTLLNNAKSRIK